MTFAALDSVLLGLVVRIGFDFLVLLAVRFHRILGPSRRDSG